MKDDYFAGAIISPDSRYRYLLWRNWEYGMPYALFIMLNPSTADAEEDDPTIRRCIGFAKRWGFGGLKVVNVFAYRATDPKELKKAADPIGPTNQIYIHHAIENAGIIICAWGAAGPKTRQAYTNILCAAQDAIKLHELYCLGLTKDHIPRHPLYLKNSVKPALLECELTMAGYRLRLSGEVYENRVN